MELLVMVEHTFLLRQELKGVAISVCLSVMLISCLEYSIFVFLAQIIKQFS